MTNKVSSATVIASPRRGRSNPRARRLLRRCLEHCLAMTFLLSHFALAQPVMSNGYFTAERAAVLSGGGMGGNGAFSDDFILTSYAIGEVAAQAASNASFTLKGGILSMGQALPTDFMRLNVNGTVDDPMATLYVNEICGISNGSEWIAPFVTVEEGENTLLVHAYDPEGNESEITLTVTVDTHPPAMPTVNFISPTGDPNLLITGGKEAESELWVRIENLETMIQGFFGSVTWSYQANLEEGLNLLEFFLTDPAGNKSAAFSAEIILDTDTGIFEILSPHDGAVTQAATVDVFGKILDNAGTVTVESQTVTLLGDGTYFRRDGVFLPEMGENAIAVHGESVFGFVQDETVTVIRDDTALFPPTINPMSEFIGTTSVFADGDCDVETGVAVFLNGLETVLLNCASGNWSSSLTLSLGDNLIMVEGRDDTGRAIVGDAFSVFADITPPTTPVVSDGGATQSSTTEINVSVFSYEMETAIVEFQYAVGTSPTPPAGITYESAGSVSVFVISGDFELDQTYYIYVRAQNAAGLWSAVGVSDGITISDNTIPSILMLLPEAGQFRYPGEDITWQLIVHDPDEDILEYHYALNGITRFTYSEEAARVFTVPANAFGLQVVQGRVRDDPNNAFQEWPMDETTFFVAKEPVRP